MDIQGYSWVYMVLQGITCSGHFMGSYMEDLPEGCPLLEVQGGEGGEGWVESIARS